MQQKHNQTAGIIVLALLMAAGLPAPAGVTGQDALSDTFTLTGADGTLIDFADLLLETVTVIWEQSMEYSLTERRRRVIEVTALAVQAFEGRADALLSRAGAGFGDDTLSLVTATAVLVSGTRSRDIVKAMESTVPTQRLPVLRFAAAYPDLVLTPREIGVLIGVHQKPLLSAAQVGAPLPTTPEQGFAQRVAAAAPSPPRRRTPDQPEPPPRYDGQ